VSYNVFRPDWFGPGELKRTFLSTGWRREEAAVIEQQKIEKAVSPVGK